jgi:flagellar motor protein MotB
VAKLDKDTNYFASMTDMMVGILFVFIIMLAYFAFQIQESKDVPKPLYDAVVDERDALKIEIKQLNSLIEKLKKQIRALEKENAEKDKQIKALQDEIEALKKRIKDLERELAQLKKPLPLLSFIEASANARDKLVTDIVQELKSRNIDAKENRQQGVVTISGEGLFNSSSSALEDKEGAIEKVNGIAEVVYKNIQCFALKGESLSPPLCRGSGPLIESIYIEGHTDSLPIPNPPLRDGSRNNLELSSKRASNTYERMILRIPGLTDFKNPANQQILSVAAYGEQRPIATNSTRDGRAQNRRIDIRFVMYVPESLEQLENMKEKFGK